MSNVTTPMADLFDTMRRGGQPKTEADKARKLAQIIFDTAAAKGVSDRDMANQMAFLGGMASSMLRDYARLLDKQGERYVGAGHLDAGVPNHTDHSKRGFTPK